MGTTAPHAKVKHRPVVAVAKHFGIGGKLRVVAGRAIADNRVGGISLPVQQVGGEGQAGLLGAAVGRVIEVEEPAAMLDQPRLVDAVLLPGPAVGILDGQDRRRDKWGMISSCQARWKRAPPSICDGD